MTEVVSAELRGPLVPRVPVDQPPPAPVRPKQASVPDLDALVTLKIAEMLSSSGKKSEPPHPDKELGSAVRTVAKQFAGILAAAIVGAVATVLVRAQTDPVPAKVDQQATQLKGNDAAVAALQTDVAQLQRDMRVVKKYDQRWQPFELQVLNRLGVKIPLPAEYEEIKIVTPAGWARVKSAPLFEVQTTPPEPPKD